MNNIRNILKERWIYLLILFIFFGYLLWVMKPFDKTKGTTMEYQYANQNNNTVPEITMGTVIVQQFYATSDNLSEIRLRFSTYERDNTSTLDLKIECVDTKEEVYHKTISAQELADNQFFSLPFKQQSHSKGRQYEITISTPDAEIGNAVTLWSGPNRYKRISNAMINGQEQDMTIGLIAEYQNTDLQLLKILCWVILFLCSVICILFVQRADERSFLLIGLLLGTLIIFYNPFIHPLDESTHFFRSFAISQGHFIDQTDKNGNIGAEISQNYGEVIDTQLTVKNYFYGSGPEEKKFNKEYEFFANPYMSSVIPVNHSISAIGIFIGNLLGFSAWGVILLSRFSVFLLYMICCYFSIKNVRYYKSLFFVVSLLPMSMWLAGSCSQDPVLNGAVLLFISICLKYYFDDSHHRVTTADCIIILLCGLSIVSVKYLIYSPLLLLFFLIPFKKFGLKKYLFMLSGASIIVITCLALQINLLTLLPFTENRNGDVDVARQLDYVSNHLSESIGLFAKYGITHLFQHSKSFNSWQTATVSISKFVSIGSIMLIPILETKKHSFSHKKKRAMLTLLISIILVIVTLISMSLYLGFTPIGKPDIDGIQTRYFIPILIPLMVFLSNVDVENKIINYDRLVAICMCFGLIDMLAGMLLEVFA